MYTLLRVGNNELVDGIANFRAGSFLTVFIACSSLIGYLSQSGGFAVATLCVFAFWFGIGSCGGSLLGNVLWIKVNFLDLKFFASF